MLALGVPPAFAAAPTNSSFNPASGTDGAALAVNETGLTGAASLKLIGLAKSLTVSSDTKIVSSITSLLVTFPDYTGLNNHVRRWPTYHLLQHWVDSERTP